MITTEISYIDLIIKNILNVVDESKPANKQKLKDIYASAYEMILAVRLDHIYVDEQGYDAISKSRKLLEYKVIMTCNSSSLTVNNLNGKEDVILYIGHNVVDNKEHFFYFPKYELSKIGSIDNISWCEISEENIENYSKLMHGHLGRGKMMFPKNYQLDKYFTWKKEYIREREFSENEIRMLSVFSDIEIMTYINNKNKVLIFN